MALSLHAICESMFPLEIELTTKDIKAALWPGNVDLARTLISKRMGLRICAGARAGRHALENEYFDGYVVDNLPAESFLD
jgi:hypothetical protein